jgi:hypothetical protein
MFGTLFISLSLISASLAELLRRLMLSRLLLWLLFGYERMERKDFSEGWNEEAMSSDISSVMDSLTCRN